MTNISHEQARANVLRGRDDLKATEQAALDEHLRACADCRAYTDEIVVMQATVRGTLQRRWDAVRPAAEVAPTISARLPRRKIPQQVFSFTAGLAALVALVLFLQAFFTQQTQVKTVQSPLATWPASTTTAAAPAPAPIINDAAVTFPTPTPPSGSDFYRVQRLTTAPVKADWPVVSPDGRYVAYAGGHGDQVDVYNSGDIYVLDLNTNAETRLTDDSLGNMTPAWSPDGKRIAYLHAASVAGSGLVDYMVMNADGSNKTAIVSSARWLEAETPVWSPAGDRVAVFDRNEIVIVDVNNRHEIRRLIPPENQTYAAPGWFDEDRLLYIASDQLQLVDVNTGKVQQAPDPAVRMNFAMAANPRIVYVGHTGSQRQVGEVQIDGTQPETWAVFSDTTVLHAALSPDGQFVAVQTSEGIYVAAKGLPASWQNAPLFHLEQTVHPAAPRRVAWLPDSSGFVFVSAQDGQPGLYLAQLNQSAIDYLKSLPQTPVTATPTRSLPSPTPSALAPSLTSTPLVKPSRTTSSPSSMPPTATPHVPPTSTPYVPPTATPYVPPTPTPYVPPTATPYVPPTPTPYVPPTSTPYVPPTPTPYVPPTSLPSQTPTRVPTSTPTTPPPPTSTPTTPPPPTATPTTPPPPTATPTTPPPPTATPTTPPPPTATPTACGSDGC